VRADAKENVDLFWALRGGGGNFGVVTEFQLKLHPLKSVVLGQGLTPEAGIRRLLKCWRDFMADAPFDLKWNLDLRLAPHNREVPAELRGRPVAGSSLVWTGAPEEAQRRFERAFSLCHADSVRSQNVSFLHLQTMADSDFPHGRRYYTKSGYFHYIDDSTIDNFLEALTTIPSLETQIELSYLGGAAGQVAAHETAVGERSAPFITNLLANWMNASDDAFHVSWVRSLFQKLRRAMKPGVYVNFMSGDEQDRVAEAYQQQWERMVGIKTQYDPGNFFCLNQNVQPRNRK